jgi:hypothetical protein
MLATARGSRLVYEPINVAEGVYTGEEAALVDPSIGPGPGADAVIAALRGEMSNPWVDQLNRARFVARSVTKDVRALGVAGDVAVAAPDSPIVVLVRHPLAVARSVVDLGWTASGDRNEAMITEVSKWCELHAAALSDVRLDGALFVAYESLLTDPTRSVSEVLGWAATFDPTWRRVDVGRIDTGRPSSTDFLSGRDRGRSEWAGIDRDVVDESLALLERHGLGRLYGETEEALVDVGELAAALRSRARG